MRGIFKGIWSVAVVLGNFVRDGIESRSNSDRSDLAVKTHKLILDPTTGVAHVFIDGKPTKLSLASPDEILQLWFAKMMSSPNSFAISDISEKTPDPDVTMLPLPLAGGQTRRSFCRAQLPCRIANRCSLP